MPKIQGRSQGYKWALSVGTGVGIIIATTATSLGSQFSHPQYGIVDDKHPAYVKAYQLCDSKVYGKGFAVGNKVYRSKAAVREQVFEILKKLQKTPDEANTIARWATVQKEFISCIDEQDFKYRK
ncbi:hypothetical protein [Brucella endophytica]|nr:hypothetical protein [Brucella endophytica]